MIVYFHIDELHRDAVVASALKRRLAERGHTLVYGNRVSNRLVPYFHQAFDVIVMPRPHVLYDNWGDAWLKWKCRFVMLSTESLGIICKDHQVMARALLEKEYFEGQHTYVDRIDAFCLWGRKQKQAVRDYAHSVADKCHVVGHPRHDRYCRRPPTAPQPSPEARKRRVGVITRAVAINDYFGRSTLHAFSVLLNRHFTHEYYNEKTGAALPSKRAGAMPAENLVVQTLDARSCILAMAALSSAGYDVSIRVHPKERAEAWREVLRGCSIEASISDPKQPITEWLRTLDYVVGPPSTSFYDALLAGVTPIDISTFDSRRDDYVGEHWEDNNNLMPFIFKARSPEELLDYIGQGGKPDRDKIDAVLGEEANFPECGNSLGKVVAVCEGLKAGKGRYPSLLAFELARGLFGVMWRTRNLLIGRRENSAAFAFTRKVKRFIDGLSRDAGRQ